MAHRQKGVNLYLPDHGIRPSRNRQLPEDRRRRDPDHWQSGVWNVPKKVGGHVLSLADIEAKMPEARNALGRFLESEGYRVISIEGPFEDNSVVASATTDADYQRYLMWARVERAPVEYKLDVPDDLVPTMLAAGLKLA